MGRTDILILTAIAALALVRLVAIAVTPLGLDVEEAQYWLWSTTPDAGYFTKPPMIAWVIGTGTSIFGDTAFGVRALAPVLQAISSVLIWRLTQTVFGAAAGQLAAVIWMTLPAAALGGLVISTDSPMILFLLAALVMLAPLANNQALSPMAALLAGVMTGLALMSKYAAIYMPAGLVIWWLWQGRRHHLISLRTLGLYLAGAGVSLAPNLVWNLNNGFVTARHLSHNANLDEPSYSILGSLEFLLAQGGVVGPLVMGVTVAVMARRFRHPKAPFWIALFLPAISVITVQGFFSDANANWAIASWPPAVVLAAGLLVDMTARWRQVMTAGIALNTALAGIVLMATIGGSFGPLTPASDPLRRLRHWDTHARDLTAFAERHHVTTIVTERRGTAAKLIWETRAKNLTIELVDANGIAENHFEQRHPWRPQGRRIILVNEESLPSPLAGVNWTGVMAASDHRISAKRQRSLRFHLGMEP